MKKKKNNSDTLVKNKRYLIYYLAYLIYSTLNLV